MAKVLSTQAEKLLSAPLNQIGQRVPNLKPETLNALATEFEGLAQRAAWMGEYLAQRGGMGSGDCGHEAAMKAANRVCGKVRKAMGFTYPVSGLATVKF